MGPCSQPQAWPVSEQAKHMAGPWSPMRTDQELLRLTSQCTCEPAAEQGTCMVSWLAGCTLRSTSCSQAPLQLSTGADWSVQGLKAAVIPLGKGHLRSSRQLPQTKEHPSVPPQAVPPTRASHSAAAPQKTQPSLATCAVHRGRGAPAEQGGEYDPPSESQMHGQAQPYPCNVRLDKHPTPAATARLHVAAQHGPQGPRPKPPHRTEGLPPLT